MENNKVLSVIYSCKDGEINSAAMKEAGFSEDRMEVLCVDEDRSVKELAEVASKATGTYVTFVRKSDQLEKKYFGIIEEELKKKYKIYSVVVQKAKGEKKFFRTMFQDEVFDYVDVRDEHLKVLSGFLGTVIRRDVFLKYAEDMADSYDESLVVTKIILEDGIYGFIPAKLLYKEKGNDFVVLRNKCQRPEDYETVVEGYYENLLKLKRESDEGFHNYLDVLLTVDIFFRVNGGKDVDPSITKKYLKEIDSVTQRIADEIFALDKINFISANKRTYLILTYKAKGETPNYVYNSRGLVFYGKNVVLRRINSIPAQISKAQMEGDYLYLEGKIDFNLSLKDLDLVISRKELQADLRVHSCQKTELEDVGETIFGEHITKTLLFKGRIRMAEKKQIIQLSFKIGGTRIPLNLKIVKNSQADRYFSCKKEYDNYILEKLEKRYITFVENTKENCEEQLKRQYALWSYVYGKDKVEKVKENIKKFQRLAPIFGRNKNLLVTCNGDIPEEIKKQLKQQKGVKVRVCSIDGKEIDGFSNIKFGTRKHRIAYIFDQYELSLLDVEKKYSAFGKDKQFYEGIRRAKLYELQ
ncbi:MAG: hypothetical protein K6G64_06130 [Eubacterium sp.]|nr:hypothetical protein [Eubacterium sp.]